jgi:hypothetical protein
MVLLDELRGVYPELSRLTRDDAQFIDLPLRVEDSPKITTIVLIPVIWTVVQIKRGVISFVEIDSKRRRLKMASVEGDRIVQRDKNSRVQPMSRGKINGKRKKKKAQPQVE